MTDKPAPAPLRSSPTAGPGAVMSALVLVACLLPAPLPARADAITLRASARVRGPVIRLGDVAELDGPQAGALADLAVGQLDHGRARLNMTDIRCLLDDQQVNWARMILRGCQQITVIGPAEPTEPQTQTARPPTPPSAVEPAARPRANPTTLPDGPAVEIAPPQTLDRLLRRWLAGQLGADEQAVRIEKLDGQNPAWQWTDLGCRYEFESLSGQWLGRLLVAVRRYRGSVPVAAERLAMRVAVRRAVVVTARPVRRGQCLTRDDLRLEQRWLTGLADQPLHRLDQALGQTAAHAMEAGQVLGTGDVQPQRLVRRGQIITIRCLQGALVVKTVGRAMEDGSAGQVIQVRNDRTRQTYQATVTGPLEAVICTETGGQTAQNRTESSTASAPSGRGGRS